MQYAIHAGRLIDGTGQSPQQDVILTISSDTIESIQPKGAAQLPEGIPVLDASSMTMIPGMIEAHTHVMGTGDPAPNAWRDTLVFDSEAKLALQSYVSAQRVLEAGFTTLRDAGSKGYVDVDVRDRIARGDLDGPRMVVCGEAIAATGGHMDRTKGLPHSFPVPRLTNICDSPGEARRAVRYQVKMGADFIKIAASLSEYVRAKGGLCSPELTQETMTAICETAHSTGRKVGAHCHGGDGVTRALQAGVDCLEHGRFLSDEQMKMMVHQGVYLVPTLSPDARAMEHFTPNSDGSAKASWLEKAHAAMFKTVQRAHELGVRIGVGSDATMPYVRHGETAYEMELLVQAGLSPMDAIVSATRIGSEIVDMADRIGTLEAGKLADLVLVAGDPLEDIGLLQDPEQIRMVIQGGRVVVDRTAPDPITGV